MGRWAIATALFGIVTVTGTGMAGAAPTGGTNAVDTINQLRAQGYTVQVSVQNGPRSSALSACTVTEVSGTSGTNSAGMPLAPAEAGTVYVDVNCADDD